tara:strand:+ start:4054 stop:5199 length:1146 start_codon:yes stop_codon:yes gene_type:complete
MNCQIDKFIIEGNTTYLNCAYMSPMLKIVEEAGINGLKTKRAPQNVLPEDFFSGVNALKKAFAKLINLDEHERIAISSSVSYGLANITNNIQLKESDNIILIGDQFPSNVYPWMELTKKYNANLKFINKPNSENNAGRAWNKKILNSINKQTKVVAMGLLHWADGTIYDIEKIRKKTKEVDALLIIDGTQSIGVMPFDIKETQPDALICAGYKWLMGPYGIGLSYYGPFFDNGKPIEESWINRKNSEDFSNLINYEDEYGEYARRYSVGQQSNFINISMLKAGIDQLNHWGIENVYKYIESITTPCFPLLNKKNTWYEDSKFRSSHLFGIRPKKNLKKILEKIRENNIFISLRGDIIRVSPSVYNTKEDVQKLFECISENA